LLRCLERRETRRIGDEDYTRFDARIVAATNKDLLRMISKGTFRDDLYYRLASIRIDLPRLFERGQGNVALLADRFLELFAKERRTTLRFDRGVYPVLKKHPWPGNVRELYHVVRNVALMAEGEVIFAHDLSRLEVPVAEDAQGPSGTVVEELVRLLELSGTEAQKGFRHVYATHLMTRCNGNLTQAARMAGVCRNTFKGYLRS
ncbi:MAG: sigma-54-dependent Fis family transcriptional regulator, partial [Myxococcales bacterium]|nr:sigma-54-dependent Fis family transcriptional regulator [Myxococcales bacterium]